MNALHAMPQFIVQHKKTRQKGQTFEKRTERKSMKRKKWKKIIINDFEGTNKKRDFVRITKRHELTLMLEQIKRIQIDL